jgi:ABC-type branched-subunit amino acid transport system ATPase component
LEPLPALRVADVVGLGVRAPQPPLWQALIGTSRSRALSADDEAMVRALSGRVGLAGWVDRTAVNLPLKVEALVEITRALAGLPHGFVWRRPEWLDPGSLAELNEVVAAEQALSGFAVVEVRSPSSLPPQ